MATQHNDYAFRSPYSQSSYETNAASAAAAAANTGATQHGAMRDSTYTDKTYDDDDQHNNTQRAELYSNTLNNNGQHDGGGGGDLDYPTRGPIATGAPLGDKSYADPGYHGSAAYGRKGIWTHHERTAFARRSAPVKIIRSIFCFLIIGIIIAVSAVLLIVTFARPPNVGIGAITSNSTVPKLGATSLSFNVSVDITISNPNDITATLTSLKASAYDRVRPETNIGQGEVTDVKIESKSNTTFALPFAITYDALKDTNRSLITDLATKCGWLPGTSASNLDFTFKIDARLSVLSIAIPFGFTVSPAFTCPISGSAISSLLGSAGGSLQEILKALGIGGSSGRRSSSLLLDGDGGEEEQEERRQLLDGPTDIDISLRNLQFEELLSTWRSRQALQQRSSSANFDTLNNEL